MTHDDAGTTPVGEGRRSSSPASAVSGVPTTDESVSPAVDGRDGRATTPGRAAAILGAIAAGAAGAVFGTLLHGQILVIGGVQVPVGALAALVLAGSLFLYCGLWARNVIMTAVSGAVAYGIVALLTTSSKTLIATESEAAPTVALAGNLWLFGVLVVTLIAVAVGGVVLRPTRRRQ